MSHSRAVAPAVARRFLVLRHHLAPPRSLAADPSSVLWIVNRLGSLQFDPLEVAGRNHDLVLAARIDGYQRSWTQRLLYVERALFEAYNKGLSILPTAELPWYRIAWDRAEARHRIDAFEDHGPLVTELLTRIREGGPLSSTDVEPRGAIDWYWRPTNQVRALLEALAEAGILGLARREGNRRVYDLVERLLPADLLAERRPEREQRRHKLLSRYRAHGLLGRSGSAELWLGTTPAKRRADAPSAPDLDKAAQGEDAHDTMDTPNDMPTRGELLDELIASGALVPVTVAGVRGERYVLADEVPVLDRAEAEVGAGAPPGGRAAGVAFLAPLDPLAWDRDLLRSLFGFDYVWEVYVPAARRRWGYYVLPILFGDCLVGRIEPRIERATNRLRIIDLWWEAGFDPLSAPGFVAALAEALDAHRQFAGLARVALPRTARHRELAASVRAASGASGPTSVAR